MTIEEGLKLAPQWKIPLYGKRRVDIPGVNRNDLPKFFYNRGYRVGVEVGIGKGEFGIELCKAGLKVYGIDPYVPYFDYRESRDYRSQEGDARKNLKGYDYTIIKKFSRDALEDFEDESLDFVYIDGNHSLPYVTEDIFGWHRKVKVGGVISGHDYCVTYGRRERRGQRVYDGNHAKLAVDSCAYIMRVKRLYILGDRNNKENRDKWRSWFWFKR